MINTQVLKLNIKETWFSWTRLPLGENFLQPNKVLHSYTHIPHCPRWRDSKGKLFSPFLSRRGCETRISVTSARRRTNGQSGGQVRTTADLPTHTAAARPLALPWSLLVRCPRRRCRRRIYASRAGPSRRLYAGAGRPRDAFWTFDRAAAQTQHRAVKSAKTDLRETRPRVRFSSPSHAGVLPYARVCACVRSVRSPGVTWFAKHAASAMPPGQFERTFGFQRTPRRGEGIGGAVQ